MTTAAIHASSLACEVTRSLESPQNVTEHTLSLIRILLGCDRNSQGIKAAPKRAAKAKSIRPPPSTSTGRSRTGTKQKDVQAHRDQPASDNGSSVSPLNAAAGRKLATNVFNTSMKWLTTWSKEKQKIGNNVDPQRNIHLQQNNLEDIVPLRQRSPNRQPHKTNGKVSIQYHDTHIDLVAECALISLKYLQSLEKPKTEADEAVTAQHEQGSLMLLDRFITLNLITKAKVQATTLYQRHCCEKKQDHISVDGTKNRSNSAISQMLGIKFENTSSTNFSFITSLQSQLLRLSILTCEEIDLCSFAKQIELDSSGSPASNLKEGYTKGQLEREKAGNQLRTVSQALIRMYSVTSSDNHLQQVKAEARFSMFVEALKIKCHSWMLLKHLPQEDQEIWIPFTRAAKKMLSTTSEADIQLYQIIAEALSCLQIVIAECGFCSDVPTTLSAYLVGLAEKHGDYKKALHLLSQQGRGNLAPGPQTAISAWQKASLQYRLDPNGISSLDKPFDIAMKSTQELLANDIPIDESLLVHVARFRKVCLSIILDEDGVQRPPERSSRDTLRIACVRIVQDLLKVSRQCSFDGSLSTGIDRESQNPRMRSALTSLTKSIEAVLEILKCQHMSLILPEPERCALLADCESCLQDLQKTVTNYGDKTLSNFVESLCVQVSNLLWQQWVRTTKIDSAAAVALGIVARSIAAVSLSSLKAQKAASLGMKLEKQGSLALHLNDIAVASSSFKQAIVYYISTGTLQDAVETALSGPYKNVWSVPKTARYMLGQSLRSYTSINLTHNVQGQSSEDWFYDDRNLTPIQRAVLFEGQLSTAATHKFTEQQSNALSEGIHSTLQICSGTQYVVYCQRFVLHLLQMKSRFPTFPINAAFDNSLIDQICAPQLGSGIDVYLASYSSWLGGSLRIQWTINCNTLASATIWQHLVPLCTTILQAADCASLNLAVDDVGLCVKQLELLLAHARMKDSVNNMLHCMLALSHIYEITTEPTYSQHATILCQLAKLYDRLDKTSEARAKLTAAGELLSKTNEPFSAGILWALTYAEHLVIAQDYDAAQAFLSQAHDMFLSLFPENGSVSGRQRLDRDALLSSAAMVASRLSFNQKNIKQACHFLRQAVKVSASIWQAIEQSQSSDEDPSSFDLCDTAVQNLTLDMSSMTISQTVTQPSPTLPPGGAAFWSYFELHCSTLWRVAISSIHCGLYQDALFYGEQLQKLALATSSAPWILRGNSFLAVLYAKKGELNKSTKLSSDFSLDDIAENLFEDSEARLLLVEAFIETGQFDRANEYIERLVRAENTLSKISLQASTCLATSAKQTSRSRDNKRLTKLTSSTLNHQHIRAKTLAFQVMLQNKNTDISCEMAGSNQCFVMSGETQPTIYRLMAAQKMLERGLIKLSSDAVKCVLAESALALPVRLSVHRKSRRVSLIQADASPAKTRTRKPARQAGKSRIRPDTKRAETGEELLLQANQLLPKSDVPDSIYLPSDGLHLMGRLRSKLSLLSSATEMPFQLTSLELVLQELQIKDLVLQREIATAEAELQTKHKGQILSWPEPEKSSILSCGDGESDMPAILTENDLAELPPSWSIVSLSLAQDQKEFFLSKVVAEKPPFFLRIPLSRSDLDLEDDQDFGFQEARSELQRILDSANNSCHDSRGQGDKQARQAWFQERQTLDQQLGMWLSNVENIWLGGFRGLLSPARFTEEAVSLFATALAKALGNHLPSRQKSFGQSKDKIELHAHVMELFLGLGDPDQQDLDDAVADLLYFVVDILQFNGERNAYDEIDFDALTVEIIDALRVCHERNASCKAETRHHTILIVDKELESFPWESLSCLQGQSLSRMPSFGAVLKRIRRIRVQNVTAQCHTVSASQAGGYLLNPSSDLVSTESTIKPILESNLPSFQSLIRTIPTEAQFESMLRDNELLLYFGHGSGAQYIRGRSIRAMETCAVTLLMGCSSAKMTQCGKLESYGMPGYYVGGMSGCMGLVGTLWDVTDRDIDRFAVKLMVEWGLVAEGEQVQKAFERGSKRSGVAVRAKDKASGKSKNVYAKVEDKRGKVSLGEAVARGRDACVLRYLNGAAPVMYGIPVFLE